jgi:peroxiredoxin
VKRDPAIILVVAMVVTIMLVFGLQMSRRSRQSSATATAGAGKQAPDFTLKSLDGKSIRLSDFRGKAVLLNFWATWCQPCKIEMPWFADLQNKYGSQGLQVLGVAFDDDASTDELAKFSKDLGVNYPVLIGQEAVENAYGGVPVLPITLYIDRDGKIIDKVFGLKGKGEIEENIKKALGPSSNAAGK